MDDRRIDPETGEILQKVEVFKRADQIVRAFNPRESKRNYNHVRTRAGREQKRALKKLSNDERGFVYAILPYLEWETNMVIGDGELGEEGKPLTFAQIERLLGVSRPTRQKMVKSLQAKKVIALLQVDGKSTAIFLNPLYAFKGPKPNDSIKAAFESQVDVTD